MVCKHLREMFMQLQFNKIFMKIIYLKIIILFFLNQNLYFKYLNSVNLNNVIN